MNDGDYKSLINGDLSRTDIIIPFFRLDDFIEQQEMNLKSFVKGENGWYLFPRFYFVKTIFLFTIHIPSGTIERILSTILE